MLTTTAALAFAAGATGLSAFNFAYYRAHGSKCFRAQGAPWGEPPFATLGHAAQREWALAQTRQHYVLTSETNGGQKGLPEMTPQLPQLLPLGSRRVQGSGVAVRFRLVRPSGGWSGGARLRFACDEHGSLASAAGLSATLNGVALNRTTNASAPFPSALPAFWPPSAYAAFDIPLAALGAHHEGAPALTALATLTPAGERAAPGFVPPAASVRVIYADLAVGMS